MKELNEKKEKEKLKKLILLLPTEKKELAEGLIMDASFMVEQLSILRDHIREHGCAETYKNGENQFGKKQSTEFASYIAMQKSYQNIIKQLNDMLPKTEAVPAGEELMGFVTKK